MPPASIPRPRWCCKEEEKHAEARRSRPRFHPPRQKRGARHPLLLPGRKGGALLPPQGYYPRLHPASLRTRQACAFAGTYAQFREKNAVVIGISRDSTASHEKFAEKYGLPFILLSDPDRIAIDAYGVWQEKKRCGKVSMGIVRSTFLIDEEGRITAAMEGVKPDTNPAEVLALL